MNTGCLYRLMFPNRKAYIGITKCTAEARFAQHAKAARIAKTGCAVHLAIEKYGSESVKVETLVVADAEYRKQLEPKAIEAFNTRAPHGYNLDRKSTRLNSSHSQISYAVFCLKKT